MRGSVVTMGTFDGVHRGHQAIARRTVGLARRLGARAVAVTFARPPRFFFRPAAEPSLLTLLDEKAALLKSLGFSRVVAPRFDRRFASVPPEAFFRRFFRRRLGARALVVGYDFRFGRKRAGDVALLRSLGRAEGVDVRVVPPVGPAGRPVSSGQIRRHLAAGRLAEANRQLGRPYFVAGAVVRGDGRGRKIGFPTANLKVHPEKVVPPGVYAVRAVLPGGRCFGGMCNVGTRPTVAGPGAARTVEAHLFGFRGNLAGRRLRLEFVRRLRAERKFPSVKALADRLRRDARNARKALRP